MELFYLVHLLSMMLFNKRNKSHASLSDLELIEKYKTEENGQLIGLLYERYAHLVLGVCLNYFRNSQDAEDITMHIFTELDQKIKKHTIQHFKSWLYQVTRNECLMELRKRKINFNNVDDMQISLPEEDSDMKWLLEEKLGYLEQALAALKSEQKICVEQFYIHDKSYQEISIEHNMPIKQVKSAIQNGKRNLKIWIENHG